MNIKDCIGKKIIVYPEHPDYYFEIESIKEDDIDCLYKAVVKTTGRWGDNDIAYIEVGIEMNPDGTYHLEGIDSTFEYDLKL